MKWKFGLIVAASLMTLSGCHKDPEKVLPGVWVVSPTFATMGIMKGTESAPSANAAASAGIAFASMKMDIKEDKTFSYNMGSATVDGTWTFDKDSRLMTLNGTMAMPQAPPAQAAPPAAAPASPPAPGEPATAPAPAPAAPSAAPAAPMKVTWVAKLDDNNERLTLQMTPTWKEPQAGLPNMADLSNGIPLVPRDSI